MNLKHVGYYTLALSCLITSCEDEMQDKEVPTVSITSPAADTKLWLEVTAAAEVMDDQNVSRVEFYLNDELLGEDTEAPYELTFNSKKYEDGKYTLKTVAYDGANNQSEASREIEIFNTLLKVSIGDNYLNEFTERWLVVTDAEGEVVDYEMIENGKDIHFERPDGMNSEKFHVMMLEKYTYDSYDESINIREYHNISPQVWTLGNNKKDSLGNATINYTYQKDNSMSVWTHNVSKFNRYTSYVDDSVNAKITLTIAANPASAYVNTYNRYNDAAPEYVLINEVEIDADYNLSKDDFNLMKSGQNTTLPDNEYYFISMYGISEEGFEYQLYNRSNHQGVTNFITYIPENGFKEYNHNLGLSFGQYRCYTSGKGLPRSSYAIPQLNLEISDNNRESFSATIDREADFVVNTWQYYEYDAATYQSKSIYWYVYTDIKEGKIEAKPLEIPAEIVEKNSLLQTHITDLTNVNLSINDYNEFDSLNDYVNFIFNPNDETLYYENIAIYPDNVNARIAKEQLPKHLQEEKRRRGETW